jgi:adenylate kinase
MTNNGQEGIIPSENNLERGIDDMSSLQGKVLFPFIAPPNGGKGTQTKALSQRFNLPTVDMGGMLREVAKEDSALGRTIREKQAAGQLVDTGIVMEVLKAGLARLLQANQSAKGFILDGFPRNMEQTEGLFGICSELGAKLAKVFYLNVPNDVILERARNRRMCPVDSEIYNLASKPPRNGLFCDNHPDKELIQRNDDKEEKVQERLRSFEVDTRPILNRFQESGHLVEVDGNRAADTVTNDLANIMNPFLNPTPVS